MQYTLGTMQSAQRACKVGSYVKGMRKMIIMSSYFIIIVIIIITSGVPVTVSSKAVEPSFIAIRCLMSAPLSSTLTVPTVFHLHTSSLIY